MIIGEAKMIITIWECQNKTWKEKFQEQVQKLEINRQKKHHQVLSLINNTLIYWSHLITLKCLVKLKKRIKQVLPKIKNNIRMEKQIQKQQLMTLLVGMEGKSSQLHLKQRLLGMNHQIFYQNSGLLPHGILIPIKAVLL